MKSKPVQLCKVWEKGMLGFPFLAEVKLDGVRAICKQGSFFSRHLKPLHNLDQLAKKLPADWVWDGELVAKDTGAGTMEAWGHTVSVVHTSAYKLDASRLQFVVFDGMPAEDWESGACSKPQVERSLRVRQMCEKLLDPQVVAVAGKVVEDQDQLEQWFGEVLKTGGEGLVLKSLEARYAWKRSMNWWKLKTNFTVELKCTGVEEGEGRCAGTLGALKLEGGLRVGTGFSDEERDRYWRKPPVGKWIEVRFQEKTQKAKLRFPSFLRVREDLA